MSVIAEVRHPAGTPAGGRFAEHAHVGDAVELQSTPVDNSPAGVAARQADGRAAFRRDHAGSLCPKSGMLAATGFYRADRPHDVKRSGTVLHGQFFCRRCGAQAPVTRDITSGHSATAWRFDDHTVPDSDFTESS